MANFNTSIHAQFISVFVLAFTLPKLVPLLLYVPAAVLAYSTFDGRVLAALISWLLRSVDGDRQQMDLDTLAHELTERRARWGGRPHMRLARGCRGNVSRDCRPQNRAGLVGT